MIVLSISYLVSDANLVFRFCDCIVCLCGVYFFVRVLLFYSTCVGSFETPVREWTPALSVHNLHEGHGFDTVTTHRSVFYGIGVL